MEGTAATHCRCCRCWPVARVWYSSSLTHGAQSAALRLVHKRHGHVADAGTVSRGCWCLFLVPWGPGIPSASCRHGRPSAWALPSGTPSGPEHCRTSRQGACPSNGCRLPSSHKRQARLAPDQLASQLGLAGLADANIDAWRRAVAVVINLRTCARKGGTRPEGTGGNIKPCLIAWHAHRRWISVKVGGARLACRTRPKLPAIGAPVPAGQPWHGVLSRLSWSLSRPDTGGPSTGRRL
jgi:hypothetical protein